MRYALRVMRYASQPSQLTTTNCQLPTDNFQLTTLRPPSLPFSLSPRLPFSPSPLLRRPVMPWRLPRKSRVSPRHRHGG